jgi:hypothetical protein
MFQVGKPAKTEEGLSVEITRTDLEGWKPISGVITLANGHNLIMQYYPDGKCHQSRYCKYDLIDEDEIELVYYLLNSFKMNLDRRCFKSLILAKQIAISEGFDVILERPTINSFTHSVKVISAKNGT